MKSLLVMLTLGVPRIWYSLNREHGHQYEDEVLIPYRRPCKRGAWPETKRCGG